MDGTTPERTELRPALENAHYTNPDHFAADRRRIFYRSWVGFCHDSDLAGPGAYMSGHVADQPIFLIRGTDGTVRGFFNVCRHRAHRIVDGTGVAERVLVCPYHAWSYETSGALRSARGAEKGQDPTKLGLTPVRVENVAGFWFVNLDPGAEPISAIAPGLTQQVRETSPDIESYVRLCEGQYEIACNWKVFVENGLECYHCAPAHPGFCEAVDLDAYEIASSGSYTRHWGSLKAGGTYSAWKLFPWTGLRATTNPHTVTMITQQPLAADRTIAKYELFGPAEMQGDTEQLRGDWIDTSFVHEDVALSESSQIGLNSLGFPGGLVMHSTAYDSEHMLTDFQNWVRARLADHDV